MRQVPGVSLQRKLLLWLLLPQLVLWLSGGFLAWRIALQNGEKGIDQTLTQSVRALARQIKPVGDGLLVDFPKAAQDILEQDPADRITYMVSSPPGRFLLGNAQLPAPPAQPITLVPHAGVMYFGCPLANRFGSASDTAIDSVPRKCGIGLNSALRSGSGEPPCPVPVGSPVCAMNPSITR